MRNKGLLDLDPATQSVSGHARNASATGSAWHRARTQAHGRRELELRLA